LRCGPSSVSAANQRVGGCFCFQTNHMRGSLDAGEEDTKATHEAPEHCASISLSTFSWQFMQATPRPVWNEGHRVKQPVPDAVARCELFVVSR